LDVAEAERRLASARATVSALQRENETLLFQLRMLSANPEAGLPAPRLGGGRRLQPQVGGAAGDAGGGMSLLQWVHAKRRALVYSYVGALHFVVWAAMLRDTHHIDCAAPAQGG
jgi:hypothetical protein